MSGELEYNLYGYVNSDGVFVPAVAAKLAVKRQKLTASEIYSLRPVNAIFAVLQGIGTWGITNIAEDAIIEMIDPSDFASIVDVTFGDVKKFSTPSAAIMAAVFEVSKQ